MPGRCEDWNRFEAAAAEFKIQGIVCLAEDAEIARKSPTYAKMRAESFPYQLHNFPIRDYGVPADVDGFAALIETVLERLRNGERLLAHCGAGIGRTGMFASCLLIALGHGADKAIAVVRTAGSGPETPEQHRFVRRFALRSSE